MAPVKAVVTFIPTVVETNGFSQPKTPLPEERVFLEY